ncbi:aspartate aminotransferase family protein [Arenibacterium halophilum]|uniref:Aminotransferase class III-fold pyridoxal phosphate-dependent enzyme n=1 Tax=Arenibacterium halophilum TaxID=2583821 RepID=A0ABY2XCH1_9RHOB|nr:aminotransferase class III-fold pyridoxal phosphate-dependent enzyme [Arenibacterium halophilum]TMV13549.1 aminotransferase class III-fold pyridoxal phosphate-dependent enzyme [Arenibacterium halophilum]
MPATTAAWIAARDAAADRFATANPESAAQLAHAAEILPGGNTRSVLYYPPFPLVMASGMGARLCDLDGHEYRDFLGEFTAGIYGHSHPVLADALHGAIKGGMNLSSQTRGEAELARIITDRFPFFQSLRFTNSGTEANIMALIAARHFTGRSRVMVFSGAYHGGPLSFGGGASATNLPFDFIYGRYNDTVATLTTLDASDAPVAAILVEGMLGAGGCIPGDPAFLSELQQWAHANGALFILDEVMTSRLHPHGLQSALGLSPDLTVMGKYLGGGMPIGVFGGRADIMARFDPRVAGAVPHAGTFNNNVMTMQAGAVGLTQVFTEEACQSLNAQGERLRARLNTVCTARGAPAHYTGIGSIMNLQCQPPHVTRPEQVARENAEMKDMVFFGLIERGFYTARRGLIALNLCLSEGDCDDLVAAFDDILAEMAHLWA